MTAEEVLVKLINLGIVHELNGSFSITTRAYDVLKQVDDDAPNTLNITGNCSIGKLYPKEIREAALKHKLAVLQNYCKIPLKSTGGFLLRSSDGISTKRMYEIMENTFEYDPNIVLKVITDYYQTIEYPKSFKNFLMEDFDTLYNSYKEGRELDSDELPDNFRWE